MMDDELEIDSQQPPRKVLRVLITAAAALAAAKRQDTETVNNYLANGGDINVCNAEGYNMLMLAMRDVNNINDDFVLNLLTRGIDATGQVDTDDEFYLNATILHCAVLREINYSQNKLFQYLLTRDDIDPDARCHEGYAEDTLHFTERRKVSGNEGAYTHGYGLNNATALHFAAINGNTENAIDLCQTGRANLNALADFIINRHHQNGAVLYEYEEGEKVYGGIETLAGVWVNRGTIDVERIRGVTALQLAAMAGHVSIVECLITNGADPNIANSTGATPLLSAAEYGKLDCVVYLAEHSQNILNVYDKYGGNTLITAAINDHRDIVKFLREEKQFPLETKDLGGYTALDWTAKTDSVGTFSYLLSCGAKVTKTTYSIAGETIRGFFDYKAGRKALTVWQRLQRGPISADLMEKLWFDYQDTTDDDSSDDEDIKRCEAILARDSVVAREDNEKKCELHDAKIASFNTARMAGTLNYADHADLRFITYRGLHFNPHYFNKQQRKQFYKSYAENPHTSEVTCSNATTKLLEQEQKQKNQLLTTFDAIASSDAHKEVKTYLEELKQTRNKKPRPADKRKTEYDRLMQDYVLSYGTVIGGGGIHTDFAFRYPYNPLISTSFLNTVAFEYASAIHSPKGQRLNPHYRRSTGKPKHPILGVVYSYAIDPQYAFENSAFILDLIHKNRIGIGGYFQYHGEVIFESLLPPQFMVRRTLVKVPDFSLEKKDTPPRLQYTAPKTKKFTLDKNAVCEAKISITSDAYIYDKNSKINKILEHVIAKEGDILTMTLRASLYRQGQYPCFPFKDGTLSPMPMQPGKIGQTKWGDLKIPSATELKNFAAADNNKSSPPPDLDADMPAADEKKKITPAKTLKQTTLAFTKPPAAAGAGAGVASTDPVTKKLNFDSPPKPSATKVTTAPVPAAAAHAADAKANSEPPQLLAHRTGVKNLVTLTSNTNSENYEEVDVPHDGSCCFYSIVLSALLPVINDKPKFDAIYAKLFGADSLLEAGQMQTLHAQLKCYDGTPAYISKILLKKLIDGDEKPAAAIGGRLRKMLGDYIKIHKNAAFVTTNHDQKALGNVDDYLNRNLYKKEGFAGTLEIAALADVLNMSIKVFQEIPGGLNYVSCYNENKADTVYLIYLHTEGNARSPARRHYHYLLHPNVIGQLKPPAKPAAANAGAPTSPAGLTAKLGYLAPTTPPPKPTGGLAHATAVKAHPKVVAKNTI